MQQPLFSRANIPLLSLYSFFFFNDTATTEIYTLSLHDALPISISLNPASRGLLLDPTNGLSDIERAEVRALTIHSFTNQPIRLLRVLRYAARMGFKIEQRTQEWFDLAIERNLQETITSEDAGEELRAAAREERPAVVLKAWEEHDLLEAVNPVLAKKHPSYDAIGRLMKVREDLFTAGFRPRLAAPMLIAI